MLLIIDSERLKIRRCSGLVLALCNFDLPERAACYPARLGLGNTFTQRRRRVPDPQSQPRHIGGARLGAGERVTGEPWRDAATRTHQRVPGRGLINNHVMS
jgi:hypothetical protein